MRDGQQLLLLFLLLLLFVGFLKPSWMFIGQTYDDDDDILMYVFAARFCCHLNNTHSFPQKKTRYIFMVSEFALYLSAPPVRRRSCRRGRQHIKHFAWIAPYYLCAVCYYEISQRLQHFTLFCKRNSCQASMHAPFQSFFVVAVNKLLTVQCHTVINQKMFVIFFSVWHQWLLSETGFSFYALELQYVRN